MMRRWWSVVGVSFIATSWCATAIGAEELLPVIQQVDVQPLRAQTRRVVQALEFLGEPLTGEERQAFDAAVTEPDEGNAVAAIQRVLDQRVLATVNINAESRVKVARGPAPAELVQQGWKVYLVKVHNEAGVTAALRVQSPQAADLYRQATNGAEPDSPISPADVQDRFLEVMSFEKQPLAATLSGLLLEYRIVQLYCRDAGQREATLTFDVGQGTQDLGFRNEVAILFQCRPAVEVELEVIDFDGKPTTAEFTFRDRQGRVYPARSRRLEPDFFFHDQVYRRHGETIVLPPGTYDVTYTRGPEYRISDRQIDVPNLEGRRHRERFRLDRWIHMAELDWYSGDHHVHAAGCSHYDAPTQGVTPESMMRHILGEDLNVGCVLSWGPCWYFQKQFFEGKTSALSRDRYLMRYDVEVSGFPSSHAGHLCLLNLSEDDYPGTTRIEEWPSWDLPVLAWGKRQGGVVGFSHSGWGLKVDDESLPSYEMPPFDGIGANEFVVDVVHGVCDFISAVDTPVIWELSIWYHTLNCGFTTRISGETDFPCIYGDRVGLGRIYVKLPSNSDQPLNFEQWVEGVRDGRSYCGDGLSHLFDFAVDGLEVGTRRHDQAPSHLVLAEPKTVRVTGQVAALLDAEPMEEIRDRRLDQKPYWHVERARVGDSRRVPVEVVVNGKAVARREIEADGSVHDLLFDVPLERSSWIALRIFPTCHTNPVFVEIGDQPIRASRRSAVWCREAVDVCWNSKVGNIRESERAEAEAAFEQARVAYDKIIAESVAD